MKVAVWDTYVTKKDGTIMHFDIIVPEEQKDQSIIYGFGKQYLKKKNLPDLPLTSKECTFCHLQEVRPDWRQNIIDKGYHIYEMENCN